MWQVLYNENIMKLLGSCDPDEALKMTYGGNRRRSQRTISLTFEQMRGILIKGPKGFSKKTFSTIAKIVSTKFMTEAIGKTVVPITLLIHKTVVICQCYRYWLSA